MVAEDPVAEENAQFLSRNRRCAGNEVPLLRQAIHYHTDSIVTLGPGQASHEVDRYVMPRSIRYCDTGVVS